MCLQTSQDGRWGPVEILNCRASDSIVADKAGDLLLCCCHEVSTRKKLYLRILQAVYQIKQSYIDGLVRQTVSTELIPKFSSFTLKQLKPATKSVEVLVVHILLILEGSWPRGEGHFANLKFVDFVLDVKLGGSNLCEHDAKLGLVDF